jgi:hypothetical protein
MQITRWKPRVLLEVPDFRNGSNCEELTQGTHLSGAVAIAHNAKSKNARSKRAMSSRTPTAADRRHSSRLSAKRKTCAYRKSHVYACPILGSEFEHDLAFSVTFLDILER